jgi:flavin-binding protein dodecin
MRKSGWPAGLLVRILQRRAGRRSRLACASGTDQTAGRRRMTVAKVTEITSSSNKSFEDAITQGISRASQTLDNIQGAWIKEQMVRCDGENITEFRVTMKVTFVLK